MIDSLLPSVHGLKMRVDAFGRLFPGQTGRFFLQLLVNELTEKVWHEQVELLSVGITELADRMDDCFTYGDSWIACRKGRTNRTIDCVTSLFFLTTMIITLSIGMRKESAPSFSRQHRLMSQMSCRKICTRLVDSCILTSATLSSGGSFAYISQRLGLDADAKFMQFSSPFDYRKQTLLYVPETLFPEPTDQDFQSCVGDRVLQILRLSQGRALVLCTSFKGMDALAAFLEGTVDYPVLVQGRASRNALLNRFREETHSVLLAVASFWEGVDVVGESLSCVIIDKLPFEVPSDPVIKARIERIKEDGGKPFFDFQVPRAILTLRQGVGRLMRSVTDRGVIAILDVRLYKKGYGRVFLKSLPPSPITRDLADVAEFYAEPAHAEVY